MSTLIKRKVFICLRDWSYNIGRRSLRDWGRLLQLDGPKVAKFIGFKTKQEQPLETTNGTFPNSEVSLLCCIIITKVHKEYFSASQGPEVNGILLTGPWGVCRTCASNSIPWKAIESSWGFRMPHLSAITWALSKPSPVAKWTVIPNFWHCSIALGTWK